MTHICISKPTTIGSDNGLSPSRCQAIIWTNAGILKIGPLGTNFGEISIKIHTGVHFIQGNAFENVVWKMAAILSQPPCVNGACRLTAIAGAIDPSHKSQNASDKYPTIHHFVTEMCTFLLQNVALWDMAHMHSGICEMGLLSRYPVMQSSFCYTFEDQNLRVSELHLSCSDLMRLIGYQDSSSCNGHQATCPV